uniref:Uncharacterized protein n=1 Tax=Anopheles culicifacies TaxID=139723 RepID=A0A182MA39_9DIPT
MADKIIDLCEDTVSEFSSAAEDLLQEDDYDDDDEWESENGSNQANQDESDDERSAEDSQIEETEPDKLEKENMKYRKLAAKHRDELEEMKLNLSNVQGQQSTLQAENDRLREELRDTQSLKVILATQNENEVKRLNSELTDAKASLEKMQQTNQKQLEESNRLKEETRNTQKHQQSLTITLETQKEKHQNEVKRLNSELANAKESLEKMKQTNQKQLEESCRLKEVAEEIATSAS